MQNTKFMEVFDGKEAAQDYMSKHTLAFSTPELTLMRFAFWLGDSVPDPKNEGGEGIPRMMTYLTEQDFQPVLIDDDKYEPSGQSKVQHLLEMHIVKNKQMGSFVLNAVQLFQQQQSFVLNAVQHNNKKIIFAY